MKKLAKRSIQKCAKTKTTKLGKEQMA